MSCVVNGEESRPSLRKVAYEEASKLGSLLTSNTLPKDEIEEAWSRLRRLRAIYGTEIERFCGFHLG